MKVFVAIICSILVVSVHAQVKVPKNAAAINTSIAAKYGETITAASLSKHLQIIASPEMEGRETATRGQEKAAAYIVSQFTAAGLQPGANGNWEQYYPLYSDSLISCTITAAGKTFFYGKDFIIDLQTCHLEDISASKIIFADESMLTTDHNDYINQQLKDQLVLIKEEILPGARYSKGKWVNKIKIAEEKNIKALIVVTSFANRYKHLDQRQLRKTDVYTRKDTVVHPNVYYITPDMAAAILGEDSSYLQATAKWKKHPSVIQTNIRIICNKVSLTLRPSNVLGFLEGTDKKAEVVFVTAHYDHLGMQKDQVFYGADDDGSGTSAVIAIATAFSRAKKEGFSPRRSMVFMTVSGEEKGLLGSKYYTDHPVYPLKNTIATLNIDMIGRIDPAHEKDTNYIYIIGDNKLSTDLRTINEKANDTYTHLKLDYKYNGDNDPEGFYYRSDHYMFAQHGIPVIFYFNGTHADYHRPTDTIDKINYQLLARRAKLVFYTAWDLANREGKLFIDKLK